MVSEEDNPDFSQNNILMDQCTFDELNEWRGIGNDSEIVLELGCRQDIQAVWIKNGLKDFKTQNFTISVATLQSGPWKQVLNGSLPLSSPRVINIVFIYCLNTGVPFRLTVTNLPLHIS